MSKLTRTIEDCHGIEGCFGLVQLQVNSIDLNPLVFNIDKNQVKVIIITEQPRTGREGKESIKQDLIGGPKNRVPQRLLKLLGDEFRDSILKETGVYYWTHFVKCPGNFRKVKGNVDRRACANKHLLSEISALRPQLIICIGNEVSRWILELAGVNEDWRDCVLNQICKRKLLNFTLPLGSSTKGKLEVRIAFLFHPAERSGIGWHFDQKLREVLRDAIAWLDEI